MLVTWLRDIKVKNTSRKNKMMAQVTPACPFLTRLETRSPKPDVGVSEDRGLYIYIYICNESGSMSMNQ